jgi:hypothetical protein
MIIIHLLMMLVGQTIMDVQEWEREYKKRNDTFINQIHKIITYMIRKTRLIN